MRSRPAAVLAAVLATTALGLSACGADSSVGDAVPKSTPDLTVPAGADSLASGGTDTSTTSTTGT
ncbi:MAG: hypothetical protein QOD81_3922, partial [Solirubrobacteraceae bacterium]|nr:hypothetical protein [Solirubrobacteraceae bacterium]